MKVLISISLLVLSLAFVSCDKRGESKLIDVKIDKRIFDTANLLSDEQEDSIFQLINDLENEIGPQIAIVTIDSLDGQNLNTFSFRTSSKLKLGRADFDDGILITVVVKSREMRIEVGVGLEKIIKDEIASRINRNEMAPSFRENDYAGGLIKGIQKIKKLIEENRELVGQRP